MQFWKMHCLLTLLTTGTTLWCLILGGRTAEATPPVKAPTCSSSRAQQPYSSPPPSLGLFGVSQPLPPSLGLRGGAVEEPASPEDVNALILKAGAQQKLVVIDFTAAWCGPCKMIAPLFKQMSEAIPDVMFLKVDVDENPDTAAEYNVSAMPTFVFIKGGEVIDRLMGGNPARLEELIHEYM